MWLNFGEISCNSYEDIVFTQFFGSLPVVTLIFDLLTPKSKQHIYEPKYICDRNWVKFPLLFFEILCSQGLWNTLTHRLTHRRTHPKIECLQHWRFSVAEANNKIVNTRVLAVKRQKRIDQYSDLAAKFHDCSTSVIAEITHYHHSLLWQDFNTENFTTHRKCT